MKSGFYAEVKQGVRLRLEEEAFAVLQRTAALAMRDVAAVLAEGNVTPTQFNILRVLRGSPAGLRVGDVAARLVSPDPDVTRLLDRMEKQGWIRRSRTPEDRRAVAVQITPAGLKKLKAIDAANRAIQHRQFGRLSRSKIRQLIALLDELRAEL